jgi:hypothetical protein
LKNVKKTSTKKMKFQVFEKKKKKTCIKLLHKI